MKQSRHEFRMTLVIKDITVDNWFITGLFSGIKKQGYKITINQAKQDYLLGCYKVYVNPLSNGDRIVNLYFREQTSEEEESLKVLLEELDGLGIGWVVYD